MKIDWTDAAAADLVRLHDFLAVAAPDAAARVVQELSRAPLRLLDFPRIGEKLPAYEPREVRRIRVGAYELRYEVADARLLVLRLWHLREGRSLGDEAS